MRDMPEAGSLGALLHMVKSQDFVLHVMGSQEE